MTLVLVIDDEPQILRALRINLTVRGYQVITASTGAGALRAAAEHPPDVVILDLGLPDMSSIDVLGGLRGWLTAPVIVLSARTDSSDKVQALDAGADDYVTKPFGMDEFLARLRAAVRRNTAAAELEQPVIETDSFTVDLAGKKVIKDGAEVHLTPTEWGMLEMLARNRGKLVGRGELLKEVWGPAYATETHYLRVYLAQLRRKLEDDPSHPKHLLTESGRATASKPKSHLPQAFPLGADVHFARLAATRWRMPATPTRVGESGIRWSAGCTPARSVRARAGIPGPVRFPSAVPPTPPWMPCPGLQSRASPGLRSFR